MRYRIRKLGAIITAILAAPILIPALGLVWLVIRTADRLDDIDMERACSDRAEG